jgi:hypothetical protein
MNSSFIGIVKSNDDDMSDVNERGWCFDYVEYKNGLYFVWFTCPFEAAMEDVNEYSLLEMEFGVEPIKEYHNGNIMTIKDMIDNKDTLYLDFINSHKDSKYNWDCAENDVKKWLDNLVEAKENEKYLDRYVIGSVT